MTARSSRTIREITIDIAPGSSVAPIRTPDQRLRVFISSTLGELAEERHAARAAVEQLRLTPILFELGARPHPPRALYRSYLAQSDVFVGIYWQRYGWVAPDMEISGLEDELVLSADMPRLVYLKRPAPEMDPRLREMLGRLEGEDSASYKPFADVTELRELLVDDLALLMTERFTSSDAAPSPQRSRAPSLPAPTSSFLGRESELADLHRLLGEEGVRLVTLTGPGGTGKTRLAVETATQEVSRFDDGVQFLDLSAEREPDDAFAALVRALGLDASTEGSPLDVLRRELRERELLLVLDNVEQVTSIGPGLVDLLRSCGAVKALVTSREPLRVSGERLFPVTPLSVPAAGGRSAAEDVLRSEAGRLFAERAAAVGTGFTVTDANANDVAAICQRLDGLPLALELAAAQVKLFAADELRERLESRLEVLKGGARDLPTRQQTLRSTIEWSDALLTDEQRCAFRNLSVFSPARLADIETTFGRVPAIEPLDVVDTVSALVDKNLVRVLAGADGRPRFSMLQTIRQYAREQLDADPAPALEMRGAHASHYTQLALDLHRHLTFADRAVVLDALAEELGNLRTAWEHWVDRRDVVHLDDLLEPLWGYFEARGDYRAIIVLGNAFLQVLAELPETPERKHDELTLLTNLARTELAVRGFTPEAERSMQEAIGRSTELGDDRHRFAALRSLASLRLMRYELEPTKEAARGLMEIAEKEADPALLSEAHLLTGISSSWMDDLAVAIEHLDQSISCFEATKSGFVEFRVGPNPGVVAYAVAGLLGWQAGGADTAVARMDGALQLAKDLDHPYSVAYALHHAALLDLWRMDHTSVEARTTELRHLTDTHDYPVWRALALILHGTAAAASGRPEAGLEEIDRGFAIYEQLSTPPVFWPMLLMVRAAASGMAGHVDVGLELIAQAEAGLASGDPVVGELAVARGDLLLAAADGDAAHAEALFEEAAALAASRGARMLELEALLRLASLRPGAEPLARLRAVYDTFSEGFDTVQLTRARALLGDT
ncbi:MAG: ATP-binding protein [Acidimicrobiales bacterium]